MSAQKAHAGILPAEPSLLLPLVLLVSLPLGGLRDPADTTRHFHQILPKVPLVVQVPLVGKCCSSQFHTITLHR